MTQSLESIRSDFVSKEWQHWSSAQSKFVRLPDSTKTEIADHFLSIIAKEREEIKEEVEAILYGMNLNITQEEYRRIGDELGARLLANSKEV